MRIRTTPVGTTSGHSAQGPRQVDAYTLEVAPGRSVTVWTYGATLAEVLVPDRRGRSANVVVRLPDLEAYEDRSRNAYVGCTMGRFARAIANSRFQLDGETHHLSSNDGAHHFHGGPIGFDRLVWDAFPEETPDELAVRMRLESPDGDQGYPGAVSAEVTYRLDRDARLTLEYRATTSAATIVGLTNHSFWNLAGEGTIDSHLLRIHAGRVLLMDEELLPRGAPAEVAGTELDYSERREIGDSRIDNCFALDGGAWAAELIHPASGRALLLRTDQPGLAVYSGDGLAVPRSGLCLQTGDWPDAPNRPDYPSARLDPGDVYTHTATVDFSLQEDPCHGC